MPIKSSESSDHAVTFVTTKIFERGNVFFTLFGAIALVGVLGAGIMATVRGPLTTVVEVNRRAQADAEMAIASRLTLLEATETLAGDGDCDSDGFVEALEPKDAGASDKPTGGGFLPDAVGSKKEDPWGTNYGYCAWDSGPTIGAGGCDDADAGTIARLSGTGDTSETYTVIAVISAGPDGEFDTTCTGGATPSVTKTANADDIINEFTYETAAAASGGLWSIKSGDPATAEIDKDLEVAGEAKFSDGIDLSDAAFGASAQLKLGAASMLLPDEATLATCNLANVNLIRINTATDPDSLQICDDASDAGTGAFTWQSVSAGASTVWTVIAADQIHYGAAADSNKVGINNNNPAQALDMKGNIALTEDVLMQSGKGVVWATPDHGVRADATGILFEVANTSRADFLSTGITLKHDTKITGSTNDNTKAGLTVESLAGTDILFVRNDGKVGIGNSAPDYQLDVTGSASTDQGYRIQGEMYLTGQGTGKSVYVGNTGAASATGTFNTIIGFGSAPTLAGGENNIIIGPSAADSTDVPAGGTNLYLNIGDVIHGDIDDKRIGIGFADTYDTAGLNDTLEVNGNIDSTGSVTGNTVVSDSTITAATNIVATAGDVTGDDVYARSQVFVDGDQLGPPAECTSTEKLEWNDGAGWSCVTDMQGGSGGGQPDLEDVLTEGNDANGLDAFDFDQVGADQFCNADLTVCFTAADVSSSSTSGIFVKSGTVVMPNSATVTISTDDFVFGSLTLDDAVGADDNARMFFDKSKAAFRAGNVTTQWDTANVGTYSAAFGTGTRASGSKSFATGDTTIASGQGSVAMGTDSQATGLNSTALGTTTVASGIASTALGGSTTASGFGALSGGASTTAAGNMSTAIGLGADAGSYAEVSFGQYPLATAGTATSWVATDTLFEIGIGANSGARANALTLLKNGYMGISDDSPDSGTGGQLQLDVEGPVGATKYCDEGGNNCFEATDVGGGSSVFEVSGTLVRPVSGTVTISTDDFVFGSLTLADDGGGDTYDDNRMFFDKSKGAFRAGTSSDANGDFDSGFAVWDDANVGSFSSAFGYYTTSSGNSSFAAGAGTISSGYSSIAIGTGTTASGDSSTAMGYGTTASVNYSTALGYTSAAAGYAATSAGIGTHAGSYGETSFGQYSLNTAGNAGSWVTTDTLFEIGNGANTGARANALTMLKNGNTGIGDSSPDTGTGGALKLDVEGPVGATKYCDEAGNNCFTASTAASAVFEVSGTVVRPVSGTVTISTNDFVFGSLTLDNGAGTGDDNRMYFDKSKGAFRVGAATGNEWDDANVGNLSIAMGAGTFASNDYSVAIGVGAQSTGSGSVALGSGVAAGAYSFAAGSGDAQGAWSAAFGRGSAATADYTVAGGVSSVATGEASVALGNNANAAGAGSVAMGSNTSAGADYSFAVGESSAANGIASTAAGSGSTAAGNYSLAIGEGSDAGSYAETSLGMYGLNTAGTAGSSVATDTLFEIGNGTGGGARANALTMLKNGNTGIGDSSPDTGTGGALKLDVEGPVGATKYCDEAGDNCFEATDVSGGSSVFEVSGTVVRPVSGTVTISTNDFVFGSLAQDDDGATIDDDARMYFDKSKGAFRAGVGSDTDITYSGNTDMWDDANVGLYSTAFGYANVASGQSAFAMGENVVASGAKAIGLGGDITSSGLSSFATGYNTAATGAYTTAMGATSYAQGYAASSIGLNTYATGDFSMAFGHEARAGDGSVDATTPATPDGTAGEFSMAFGLGDNTGTNPSVTGVGSAVFFMGNSNGNYSISANNVLGVIGGQITVDDVSASANRGCIKYNSTNGHLQSSHDCTTYTDLGPSAISTLADAATVAIDWSTGATQMVTLGGNRTFTFTGGVSGARYTLIIKQDATGSRTVTWPAAARFPGGTAPTLTATASKTDYIGFIYNSVDSTYDAIAISQNY